MDGIHDTILDEYDIIIHDAIKMWLVGVRLGGLCRRELIRGRRRGRVESIEGGCYT